MKVGFIGLGDLGAKIARRIKRCGFELVACDIDPKALEAFDEPGALREADPIAVARQVDILSTCVRTDEHLISLAGDGRLFSALGKGGVFIVHSTVNPALCRRLAEVAKECSVEFIDAGVSDGDAALTGEMGVYVGGDKAAFERVRPLLECLGKTVVHLGPVGRGMEVKLLNNLAATAQFGIVAAILDLGERLNFDRNQLWQALMAGSARGYAMNVTPGLLQPELAGFTHALLSKDVTHARSLAPNDDAALAALLPPAQAMLDRLSRAAASAK